MSVTILCDVCGKPAVSSHQVDRYQFRMDLCQVCLHKWVSFALDKINNYRVNAASDKVDHGLSRAIMDAVVTSASIGEAPPLGEPAKPPEGAKALHRLVEHFTTVNKPL